MACKEQYNVMMVITLVLTIIFRLMISSKGYNRNDTSMPQTPHEYPT